MYSEWVLGGGGNSQYIHTSNCLQRFLFTIAEVGIRNEAF